MAEGERIRVDGLSAILTAAKKWRTVPEGRLTDVGLVALILDALSDPTPRMIEAGYDAASNDIGGDWSGRVEIQSVIGRSVWRAMLAELRKDLA